MLIKIILTKIKKSLYLLKEYALNADFNVPTRVDQKLISKNEVKPISSQPKKNITRLPDKTSKTILTTNEFKKIIKRSTFGSYLKYENAYMLTNKAIEVVKKAKLKETESTKNSKLTV